MHKIDVCLTLKLAIYLIQSTQKYWIQLSINLLRKLVWFSTKIAYVLDASSHLATAMKITGMQLVSLVSLRNIDANTVQRMIASNHVLLVFVSVLAFVCVCVRTLSFIVIQVPSNYQVITMSAMQSLSFPFSVSCRNASLVIHSLYLPSYQSRLFAHHLHHDVCLRSLHVQYFTIQFQYLCM